MMYNFDLRLCKKGDCFPGLGASTAMGDQALHYPCFINVEG